jgi:uncharacterized delta-60 repeat protein
VLALAIAPASAWGAAGNLDRSFSADGRVTYSPPHSNFNYGDGVAIDPDNKIVLVGTAFNQQVHRNQFTLIRFKANGRLDRSFASGGYKQVGGDNCEDDSTAAIAIQPDGKLVLAGYSCSGIERNHPEFFITRINPDGSLDRSFAKHGHLTVPFGHPNDFPSGIGVAIDSAGKIVVVGTLHDQPVLARVRPNGRLDRSFSANGKARLRFAHDETDSFCQAVAIQPDDRIVIAGGSSTARYSYFGVARLRRGGHLDSSFARGGRATHRFGGNAVATGVGIEPDGKVVIGGDWIRYGSDVDQFAVARFNPGGSIDRSFSGNGLQTARFPGRGGARAFALALQDDGKVVLAGNSSRTQLGPTKFALARFTRNGRLDDGFGTKGRVTTQFGDPGDIGAGAFGVAIQDDGKIVAGGDANPHGEGFPLAAARYLDR